MKKIFTLLAIISVLFASISCSNGTNDDDDVGTVTVKELITKIPTTIEELEKGSGARSAARVDVNLADEPGIITNAYNNLDYVNFSFINLFLTILKNDVAILSDFQLNTKKTIGNINYSQKTVDYCTNELGMKNPNMFIENLGIIEVIFNDPKVDIYWQINAIGGDNGEIAKMNIYLTGNYRNGAYDNVTAYLNYNFSMDFVEIEQLSKIGTKLVRQKIGKGEDGRETRDITEKVSNVIKLYGIGSSDLPNNPTAEQLAEAAKYRRLIYIDNIGAAEFGNSRHDSNKFMYYFYDKDGSLILEENKSSAVNAKYIQTIPLKYIFASLEKDDAGYYFKDSGEIIPEIQSKDFEIAPKVHQNYDCYVTESDSESVIGVKEGITFTKTNYIHERLSKLNAMKSEVDATASEYLTNAEIQSMKNKLVAWVKAL